MRQLNHQPKSLDEVRTAIRRALYGRSPMVRAEAEAQLIGWGLPAEPSALVIAARRDQAESLAELVS